VLGVVTLVMAALSVVVPEMGLFMMIGGGVVLVIARIWVRTVAQQEDYTQGLMVLIVPFYELYFMITRWEDCKTPFFLMVGGTLMAIVGVIFFIIGSIANEALK
jgi:hypothetical protein